VPENPPQRVPLNLADQSSARKRGCVAFAGAVVVGAAVGGIVALFAGQTPALVTAAVVIVLLTLLTWVSGRRTLWLEDHVLVSKALGRKSVDLRHADRIELMVTDIRGTRTVGLLVTGGRRSINLALAMYAGTGGRELGILVLRRLADVLAGSENTGGLVFSQLLVAQLRAEAKGEAAPDRPLYQLASLAPAGKLAQRLAPEAITRFVASLD
jgi:hypothetical protein